MRRPAAALFVTVCLLLLAAPAPEAAPTGAWELLPPGPLTPRELPVGVWTGSEVLLVGGDRSPTNPSAGGGETEPPLRDGAALDLATGTWRSVASSPVGMVSAGTSTSVIGGVVYVLAAPEGSDRRRTLLTYTVAEDGWKRIPAPRTGKDPYRGTLVDGGPELIAFGDRRAVLYHPTAHRWTALPRGPLAWRNVSEVVRVPGGDLVAFGCRRIGPPERGPCLTTAAMLDLRRKRWRRLPPSRIYATYGWVAAGRRLINPSFGTVDGGATNGFDRAYPRGGVLDLRTRRWRRLPKPPSRKEEVGGAVLTASRAFYTVPRGWVLDTGHGDTWLRLPELTPDRDVLDRTTVSAGRDLLAFGGVEWAGGEYELFGDAWIWRAPAP